MELVGFMCNSMTVSFPSGRRVWIYSADSGVIRDGWFKALGFAKKGCSSDSEIFESREDRRPEQVQKYMNFAILESRKFLRVWHFLA